MSRNFKGKVVLITGAGGGIGSAAARQFAAEGATVILADKQPTEALAEELRNLDGQKAAAFTLDVTDFEQCRQMVEAVIHHYGKIDVLFNNAGITRRASVVETTEEEWDSVIAVNLKSIFLLSKLIVPHMVKSGSGVIVNTASGWGLVGGARAASYCASKGGVVLLTKAMALDHGPDNIRVNCICPGDTLTPMLVNEAQQLGLPDQALIDAAATRPLGRVGLPEDIAKSVVFLASDDASFITGAALVVDGGGLAGSA